MRLLTANSLVSHHLPATTGPARPDQGSNYMRLVFGSSSGEAPLNGLMPSSAASNTNPRASRSDHCQENFCCDKASRPAAPLLTESPSSAGDGRGPRHPPRQSPSGTTRGGLAEGGLTHPLQTQPPSQSHRPQRVSPPRVLCGSNAPLKTR